MIKLQSDEQIKIMQTLQCKYKMGFHKARIVLDLYEFMLKDCDESFPIEQVEQLLLQLADTIIGNESKDNYLENLTLEQLKQILIERFDENYKKELQQKQYLQKLFGINALTDKK